MIEGRHRFREFWCWFYDKSPIRYGSVPRRNGFLVSTGI